MQNAVAKVKAGQLTRKEACTLYSVSLSGLKRALHRAGITLAVGRPVK
jgi:hypothetical protein